MARTRPEKLDFDQVIAQIAETVESGCDPHCSNSDGNTMIAIARKHGSKQVVEVLTRNGT